MRIRAPAQLEFPEQTTREEGTAQSTEVAEGLPECLDEYYSEHVYEETTQGQEKNYLKSLVGTVPGAHNRLGIVFPQARVEKLSRLWGGGVENSDGYCFRSGKKIALVSLGCSIIDNRLGQTIDQPKVIKGKR